MVEFDHIAELFNAIKCCSVSRVKNIVNKFVNTKYTLDRRDIEGYTLLIRACKTNNMEIVNILLSAGANIDIVDNFGRSAMFYIPSGKTEKEAKDNVITFIKYNPNLNIQDLKRNTPLMHSLINDKYSIAENLIINGADMNIVNLKGDNALVHIPYYNGCKLLSLAIKHGIDVNYKNNNGISILLMFASVKHTSAVHWLVNNGAVITEKDYDINKLWLDTDVNIKNVIRSSIVVE